MHARPARPTDYPDFVRLFPELGVDDPVPELAAWSANQARTTLVHEHDGEVIAYTYFQVLHELAYVRNVVVDPGFRGQGRGYEVMRALASHLRGLGCRRWCLNVELGNEPALRLYRGLGMHTVYPAAALRFEWDLVDRLPDADMALETCPIDPAEDDAIEAAFALPAGQLAELRARPAQLLLRLRDPADPADLGLGFAAFAPHFPVAFPFRVARPALAGPLLRALRAHALPGNIMNLAVEDDQPLTARLLTAGARLRMELLFLRGELR
ncbi:MAG: GNAT family N-acetyltransferase [Nannocystis sp.]|nr:GNAT family N-acetyltransferase [Nannocystis sp.]MBA3549861.1 GNAT family N-acetyltransferase [Nannocystis sp.]